MGLKSIDRCVSTLKSEISKTFCQTNIFASNQVYFVIKTLQVLCKLMAQFSPAKFSLYTIDGKLDKKFHDFGRIFKKVLKGGETLLEGKFFKIVLYAKNKICWLHFPKCIVVKAEILHFVQDDATKVFCR